MSEKIDDNIKNGLDSKHRLLYIKSKSNEAKDAINCPECGTLLYMVLFKSGGTVIEIKCRKCGHLYRSL